MALMITAKAPPDAWRLRTADLLSRLRLAPTVSIGPPDDDLMRAVLVKLLIDRQLVIDTNVISYIALRLERSLDVARSFIDALDREFSGAPSAEFPARSRQMCCAPSKAEGMRLEIYSGRRASAYSRP